MTRTPPPPTATLGYALFATRWLQAPLYFGLVVVQGVYVYKFFNELWTLIVRCVAGRADETYVMLAVLKLVDVVMIANLLIMVIVGGYETFVSRIDLQGHRDQPEWLSHVNPNVLKVKLATAIVGISSVHLLQMFVDVEHTPQHSLLWGTLIHMAFIVSAAILAYMSGELVARSEHHPKEHGRRTAEPEPSAGPEPSTTPLPVAPLPVTPLPIPAQPGPPEREAHAEDRVRAAGFPARKQLEDFDAEYPRAFDRDTVARLGKLDFVVARRNVLFTGAPGTGKTHLAIGLGLRACQAGHRVLFATAVEWAARLARADAAGRLSEELAGLDDSALLIVDEVGYVPFDTEAARLLFRLVAHRYERGSVIVTSDRPLERWHEVFDGPAVLAMVDRLTHHAETVRLEGDSYRKRRPTSAWAEPAC
ncbi:MULTISPECIES: IS21-like element helper ATPase IstB [unclassified Streptomyces]|uniref:IS21-like element helper ATPase IstB n=1 Tax=unclassified Streptomyces TaxID=2593676 RepID=UPI00093B4EC4|nr:IS21-like element helper ATPase IstB [Streptomyces sp. TSRI0107]OKJ84032.1 ATP-binding protein [Streptomyces sp. TSRI0107]